ncbi:MAG: hypothetical protein U9Q24_03920 [Candidatus Ratteibacteria bacterium]|nr:hypothetical protein [Candidatus Ratteibacteria bacterium]
MAENKAATEKTSLKDKFLNIKTYDFVVQDFLKNVCEVIVENISGQNIESVILIGSFSKGEGTVYIDRNNRPVFLSDSEFIVVLTKEADYRMLRDKPNQISINVSRKLKEEEFDLEVDLSLFLEKSLTKMPPTAFTYELKNYGKVVWGNRKILDVVPDYKRDDIKKEESMVVIFNRALEQLKEIFGDKKGIMPTQTYQICKGYVNLASSILIAEGKYEPLYKNMLAQMNRLDYTPIPSSSPLMEKIRKWMDFKLNPKEDLLFKSRKEVLKEWEKLRNYYKDIWLWESGKFQIVHPSTSLRAGSRQSTDHRPQIADYRELAKLNLKRERLKYKIKGWCKLILYQEKSGNFSLFRAVRLIFKGSPKMLAWMCGMGVYVNYDCMVDSRQSIVHSKKKKMDFVLRHLPVIPREYRKKKLDWNDLREIVVYNWEKFAKK